jgi:hypothetical protein
MDLDFYCRIYLIGSKRFFYEKTICFYRYNESTKTGSQPEKMRAEAYQIATIYQSYLSTKERTQLLKTLEFFKGLQKIWDQEARAGLAYLFKLFTAAPNVALKDKRFLSFVKSNLSRHFKFWRKKL